MTKTSTAKIASDEPFDAIELDLSTWWPPPPQGGAAAEPAPTWGTAADAPR